ncbi:hypothetical protein D9615_005180 [Tricholomella constricta]|uniref:Uncharacterized protein n=1 Tax=Tricholomella constricta TaxID=117010 RepID=A0A8H5H6F9_9AGAR|nr:hypothetical protein D9615_005180 [Tricholomella constricta]
MILTSYWAGQIALGAVLSLTSLGLGFHVGAQRAQGAEPTDDEDEGNTEDIADGDLSAIQAGFLEPCKLVRAYFH